MSFELRLALRGDLMRTLTAERLAGTRAVHNAVRQAGRGLEKELEAATVASGLGRLARAWASRIYPAKPSLSAAALVYAKGGPATQAAMRAHAEGALIRGGNGFFLAIPTPAAPKRGVGGGRISPSNFPEHALGRLRFVYRRGAPSLLVVDSLRARKGRRGGFARASKRAIARGETATVVMFVLVPQVTLPKRFGVAGPAAAWAGRLPGLIVANWRSPP